MKIILITLCSIILSNFGLTQNNSAHFNGTDGYIQTPHNIYTSLVNNFTIEAWIKLDSVEGSFAIVNKNWCGTNDFGYSLNVTDGAIIWRWNTPGTGNCSGTYKVSSDDIVIAENRCYHIAVVHKTGAIELYVDGVLIPSSVNIGSITPVRESADPLRIGIYKAIAGNFIFPVLGQIDELRIWSTPRTSLEIGTYYNLSLTGNEPNLSVYYNFNTDISGSNNSVFNLAQTGAVNNGMSSGVNFPTYAPSCAIILGVEENQASQNFVVYPNPGTNELAIVLDDFTQLSSIVLYDAQGKFVKTISPASNYLKIETNELSNLQNAGSSYRKWYFSHKNPRSIPFLNEAIWEFPDF